MRSVQWLGVEDYRDMPWKNGAGVTRELIKLPHPTQAQAFLARLSIATVAASGPFSRFPGIERTIFVLEGEGMALSVDGREQVLGERWQPFCFAGEAETTCRLLGGPIRDFNLMVARELARGELEVVRLAQGERRAEAAADAVLAYGLEGSTRVMASEGLCVALGAEQTLCLQGVGGLSLHSDSGASLVLIRLHRR